MPRTTYRKVITSAELTAKILEDNKDLMNEFLDHKSIKVSDKTIVVYRSNMLIFFTWNLLHNKNSHFCDIKKREFSKFFKFATDELKVGSSKLNNFRSTLSSFSDYIETFYDDDFPNFRNVILKIIESAPKEVRREKTILTDEQIEDLLEHLVKEEKHQEACFLALGVCSGARIAELLIFSPSLIDENRTAFGDIFLETTKEIRTKGRGKGGKMLYKYILRDKFLPYYNTWLVEREAIMKELKIDNHDFLFIKKDGSPATKSTTKYWISNFEKFLKVPFYAHALRHYLATLLSKKNIPHMLIKEIFGWSSLEMVNIYDDSTMADRYIPELENLKGI